MNVDTSDKMATNIITKTPRRLRKTMNVDENNMPVIGSPKTPSRRRTYANSQKTPIGQEVENRTPRRSTRKITKPFQDYNDIVRPLAGKKSITIDTEIKENDDLETFQKQKKKIVKDVEKKIMEIKDQSIEIKKNILGSNALIQPEIENTKQEHEKESAAKAVETISIEIIKEKNDLGIKKHEEESVGNAAKIVPLEIIKLNDLGLAPLAPETEKHEEESVGNAVETISLEIIKEKDDLGLQENEAEFKEKCHGEEEKLIINTEKTKDDFEEMESLIFCDDTEDFECTETTDLTNPNNDTFNASDCIILSPIESQDKIPCQVVENEQTNCADTKKLEISVESLTPKKLPRLIREITPQNTKTLFTDAEIQDEKKRRDSKVPRLPTPFKPKKHTQDTVQEECSDAEELSPVKNIILPIIENENIILPGIRKRSVSMSSDKNKADNVIVKKGRGNRVTFYSPANQTVVIEEFDDKMERENKQNYENRRIPVIPLARPSPSKVTSNNKVIQNFKPGTRIPSKKFEISKTHIKTNLNVSSTVKASTSMLNATTKFNSKPKTEIARIKLGQPKQKNMPMASYNELLPNMNKSTQNFQAASRIPTKKLEIPKINMKSNLNSTAITAATSTSILEIPKITMKSNLNSTAITAAASTSILNATSRNVLKPRTDTLHDKVTMRRQRHIEMFKSHNDRLASKRHELIRGVRSNRRFDLQMQHRQNLEK